MTEIIRVLIADDHTIVRSGVRLLLAAEADIEVIGEALNGHEAIAQVQSLQPDVVLMDISMPGMDGLNATQHIKTKWPEVNVLVLTMHRSDEYLFEMLKAGASGYVLKGADTSDLIQAVRVVAQGDVFLYPSMTKKLVSDYLSRMEGDFGSKFPLSQREKDILKLLAEGYSNTEISEKLIISPSTVHTHRSNLMKKLGLNNRHELVQYARQRGLIQEF